MLKMTLEQALEIEDLIISGGDLSGAENIGIEIYSKDIAHEDLLDIATDIISAANKEKTVCELYPI